MNTDLTKEEKRRVYRNLTILVKSLENYLVTVDLRNEISVSGLITSVDVNMNINMVDVAMVEPDKPYKYFSNMYIPSRNIRDVIIPDELRILDCIQFLLPSKSNQPRRVKEKPKRTFKKKRAQLQQQETLQLIRKMREESSGKNKES